MTAGGILLAVPLEMIRFHSFVLSFAALSTGCVSPPTSEPQEPRYTGSMHVTQRLYVRSGTVSGSVFGRITIPSQLTPTATVRNCDYNETRLEAGVTLGNLTVSGFAEPLVIKPFSFIDGMLYIATLDESHRLT